MAALSQVVFPALPLPLATGSAGVDRAGPTQPDPPGVVDREKLQHHVDSCIANKNRPSPEEIVETVLLNITLDLVDHGGDQLEALLR